MEYGLLNLYLIYVCLYANQAENQTNKQTNKVESNRLMQLDYGCQMSRVFLCGAEFSGDVQ